MKVLWISADVFKVLDFQQSNNIRKGNTQNRHLWMNQQEDKGRTKLMLQNEAILLQILSNPTIIDWVAPISIKKEENVLIVDKGGFCLPHY